MACFTRKEAKDLWDYAKATYLSQPKFDPVSGEFKGYMDFRELTNQLSDDIFKATGGQRRIVPEEIAKLIATPKAIRNARNNLLMADRERVSVLNQARHFVSGEEKTPLARFAQGAFQAPYTAKVLAHGPALHMTHAWPYFFDPAMWKDFGKTWVNAWKAINPSQARAAQERIMMNPRFDQQVKSGLAVDPRKIYDDVQQRAEYWGDTLGKVLGKNIGGKIARGAAAVAEATSHSFMGLKELRQAQWDAMYDTVPEHLRTGEMDDLISLNINHMTGAPGPMGQRGLSSTALGKGARGVMFAPSLDVARIMRPVDLLKSLGVEARKNLNQLPGIGEKLRKAWGDASPEQKWIARYNMKQWARIAGVFSGMLYMNHLLLKNFFGSKDDINVSDPFKGDWMAPKGPNGRIWQATGGQIPLTRTITRSVINPTKAPEALGNYLIGKLHPALSLAKGIYTGKTFGGEPTPWAKGGMGWTEYLTAELGPIATEDGIHEFAKQMSAQNGAPESHNRSFLESVVRAGLVTIPAAAGTHTYNPNERKKHK